MAISREYKVKIKATIDPSEISKQIEELGKKSKFKIDTGGIDSVGKSVENTGKKVKGLGTLVDGVFGKFNLWYGIAQISHKIYDAIGDVVTNTIKLDTALTGLAKVSDLSKSELTAFAKSAGEAGVEIGKTTTEMIDSAAVFAQAGWSDPKELEQLSLMAGMFTNIADTQTSTAESAEFLIATMKAFNLTADDTEHIIDAVNEVSNKYAVSSGDLASSIGRVASTLAISGTTFEETMGLMTGATEIIRNPGKVANGLKTISLRLQGMTEAADGSTEAVDGLASKMQEDFSQIGVDITDANGQIRSTYDILTDVGAVWPSLTANQKAYYAELAAGKNQANIFIALMDNMKTAVAATATAYDSAGSAAAENAKKMDSVQGSIDKFRAAWEKFTTSFVSSDLIKNIVNLGTALVEFGTTDTGKAVIGLTALSAAFLKVKSSLSFAKDIGSIADFLGGGKKLASTAKDAEKTAEAIGGIGKAAAGAAGSTSKLSGLLAAIGGPTTLAIGAAVLAIGGMVYAMDKASKATGKAQDEMVSKVKDTKKAYDDTTKQVKTLEDRASDLRKTISEIEAKDELTLVDEQNLANAKKELSQIDYELTILHKKQARQQKENEAALERAMNKKEKISIFSGLGSLSGKEVSIPQEADEIIKAIGELQSSYTNLDKASRRITEGTLKNQQEELGKTRDRMVELRDQAQEGSEDYNYLSDQIAKTDTFLNDTIPLMERNLEASDKYGNSLVQLGEKSTSVRQIADELNTLKTANEAGALSNKDYIEQLNNGIHEMATTTTSAGKTMTQVLNMSQDEFRRLSSAEQQEVMARIATWNMYGDNLKTTLESTQSEIEATGRVSSENFDTIKDSANGVLEAYAAQEGLQGSIKDGWSGGSAEAREYANQLSSVIREMDTLAGAQDLVSQSSDLMSQIFEDNINGMSVAAWEGTESGKKALSDFSSGAQNSLQEIQDSNTEAWDTFRTTVEGSTSGAYDAIIDENGRLRDDFDLTGQQAYDVYQALVDMLSSEVPGAAQFAAEALGLIGTKSGENLGIQEQFNDIISQTSGVAQVAGTTMQGAFEGAGASIDDAKGKTGILGGVLSTTGSQGASAGSNIGGKFGEAGGKIDGAKGSADNLAGALVGVAGEAAGAEGKIGAISTAISLIPRTVDIFFNVVENVTRSISEVFSGKKGEASGSDFIEESGFYTVGEAGRETVFLPRGAAVATASETRNMRGMLKSGRGASTGGVEISGDLDDSFEKIANSLVKITKTLTGASIAAVGQQAPAPKASSGAPAMARAASYDDPHKKNFDAAYDELKYLQDMDRISEQDYLNRLENLNNSYFGGRMEYLEEYRKYEVEVYKGRKKLQEQAQRDAEKAEKDRIQAVKDGFKKEEDALEYMRDKDLITEEEYYRQLAALNDKYYKGKTEFLDEYQKYEIKVYDYLKKKEEERLKELKEQTEKQYENTKDYIVDMIDKQISAEEEKLDQLDKEKEQQEKLQKIEEARKKLAEAQQQKVRVYRAGQGFVYESDAAAIEEASKELNDLLEEEKFDKQKQEIQDEIDRLEDLKDAWQDSLDINEDLEKYGLLMDWIKAFEEANYEDRLAMADQFKESYKKALEEIAKAQENISNTASTQLPNFKPNGYASGTDYVRHDEKAIVGENGPEIVNLPKGSGVLTARETQNMRMWGALTPVDLFSDIYKLISSMPRYTFDTPSSAPSFDFSSWNLDVDVDSGLVDAIQNNLRETVIQYISKRGR